MQDDLERVKAAIEAARHTLPARPTHGEVMDAYARAAMAATREIDAEAAEKGRVDANRRFNDRSESYWAGIRDWLQQRANEVKGSGNG